MLIQTFGSSLRQDQIAVLMNTLDMAQKMMFMEIMQQVTPPEAAPGPASLPPTGGANGTPAP
jgi:hypothetical protein